MSDITLSSVCIDIFDCEHKTAPTSKSGYPSVRTPNIGRGFIIFNDLNLVDEDTYRAWTRRAVPQKDDIIFAREAPVGNAIIIPENFYPCLGQRTVLIRPNSDVVNPRYLLYNLLGNEMQAQIHSLTNGATVHHLNVKDIKSLRMVKLHKRAEQDKIAKTIANYDNLIENNNRRIAILEEMAQRLYREWFVHFRFPGYENVKMVDSELGMIPEKWKSGCLADIAQNHRKSIKKADRGNYKYYLPIDCLPRKSLLLRDVRPISEAESSLTEFCEGDIIMGAMRVYFHKVISAPFSGLTRSTCFVIRPLIDTYSSYLLMTLYQNESIEYANTISVGATMPYVIWETFSKMRVIIPSLDIAKKYNDVVHPIIKEIKRVYFQNANLCKTRDHLLPRLISGDIDVSKIEM